MARTQTVSKKLRNSACSKEVSLEFMQDSSKETTWFEILQEHNH